MSHSILRAYVLDPAERAVSTFIQQFLVILLPTAGLTATQHWAAAATTGVFAAVLSLLTSIATFKVPSQTPAIDLLLRVLKTFVQSMVGTMAASGVVTFVNVDWKTALAIALNVSAVALLKGLGAGAAYWTDGASLLPLPTTPHNIAPEVAAVAVTEATGTTDVAVAVPVAAPPATPVVAVAEPTAPPAPTA